MELVPLSLVPSGPLKLLFTAFQIKATEFSNSFVISSSYRELFWIKPHGERIFERTTKRRQRGAPNVIIMLSRRAKHLDQSFVAIMSHCHSHTKKSAPGKSEEHTS